MDTIAGVANSPCSWGVLEFDLEGETAGYAQVLDEMAEAEYVGTELGDYGFLPVEPEVLREVLDERDLALAGAFVPVVLADPNARFDGEADVLRVARLLSDVAGEAPVVVLSDAAGVSPERTAYAGRIPPELGFSERQWEVAAHTANQLALSVYEETRLRTAFHPHCGGFVETPEEVAIFMDATHPHVLGLCLDTAHYAYGGGDPIQLVRRYGDRIWHVHFKGYNGGMAARAREEEWDYFEAVKQGVFCGLDQSGVDLAAIARELDEMSYSGWVVVEQDVLPGTGAPLECAKQNREYLKSIGL